MNELIQNPGLMWFILLARAGVVALILPLHCYFQARTAARFGDDTAKNNGKAGADPAVHLSLVGSVALIASGVGWTNHLPVDPEKFKHRKRDLFLTSISGILFDLFAFVVLALLWIVTGPAAVAAGAGNLVFTFNIVVYYMMRTVLMFALFNLIPIPPLDGWRILRPFLAEKTFWGMKNINLDIVWGVFLILTPYVTDVLVGIIDALLSLLS